MPKSAPKSSPKKITIPKKISSADSASFLETLQERFEKHMNRHKGMKWQDVEARLKKKPKKLLTLYAMEVTGGEPDVISHDKKTGEYVFVDCAEQSPKGRRSLCYDHEALKARKKFPPKNSAVNVAKEMGVALLTEEQYRKLQEVVECDTTTSSWIETPKPIRKHGGAIFADRRYDHVFVYHNGADSYYGARGFRSALSV